MYGVSHTHGGGGRLGHCPEDGIVTTDARSVLVVVLLCVTHLIKLRLWEKKRQVVKEEGVQQVVKEGSLLLGLGRVRSGHQLEKECVWWWWELTFPQVTRKSIEKFSLQNLEISPTSPHPNIVKKEGHEVENRWKGEGQRKWKRNKGSGVNTTREVYSKRATI